MGTPRVGPCAAWATINDIQAVGTIPTAANVAILEDCLDQATAILFHLSGRRWSGSCTATVRPTPLSLGDRVPHSVRWWSDGTWAGYLPLSAAGFGCACSGSPCGCAPSAVSLGAYPITAISSVKVDGTTVSSANYRVDEYRWLVRIDGTAWPSTQDLSLASTEVGTFEVAFTYGTVPDTAGVAACAQLALELARAQVNDDQCALPSRLRSLVRQGVSVDVFDPLEFLDHGRVGIYRVDLWLAAVNPLGLRAPAAVFSPDFGPQIVRHVGT